MQSESLFRSTSWTINHSTPDTSLGNLDYTDVGNYFAQYHVSLYLGIIAFLFGDYLPTTAYSSSYCLNRHTCLYS